MKKAEKSALVISIGLQLWPLNGDLGPQGQCRDLHGGSGRIIFGEILGVDFIDRFKISQIDHGYADPNNFIHRSPGGIQNSFNVLKALASLIDYGVGHGGGARRTRAIKAET